MSRNRSDRTTLAHTLTDDEIAIIFFCRAQGLSKAEALRRLVTPSSIPMLLHGQELELASNLTAVAVIEFTECQADPISLSGHDGPDLLR